MKKHTLLLIFLLFSINAFTQSFEIKYSEQTTWEIDDERNYSKEYKEALLASMEKKDFYTLKIEDKKSIYTAISRLDNKNSTSGLSIETGNSESYIYKDIWKNEFIKEETYPKVIHVIDSLPNYNWEIEKSDLTILGYKTYAARTDLDNFVIKALYAPGIPIQTGPRYFWGLPGLILKIEIEDNRSNYKTVIIAEEIQNSQITIKPPNISKTSMSQKEFKNFFDDFVKRDNEMLYNGVDTSD